jgi:CubicO group peptidase (beta-lactamase class C family)
MKPSSNLLQRLFLVSVIVVLSQLLSTPFIKAQAKSGIPPGLDKYIEKVLQTFDVPGMSVAIVKDGKIMLAKGYGTKMIGTKDPVDGNTLFAIASNSKAFTATALAMLVEEGKLKWDDPVVDHLPWFKMADSYVSSHLTIRDLLVHQSGLTPYSGDLMLFPPSNFTRREILNKLPKLPLQYDFRTTYAYDNILYLAAGEIIEAKSKLKWEDFIKTRIFDQVDMPNSISRFSEFRNQSNVSVAHDRIDGKIQVIDDYLNLDIGDVSDPAGGILSNANDISNWMITQLDSGRTPSKKVLFKPSTTKELWKIVRPIPFGKIADDLKPAQMDFFGYALGLRTYNYQKYKVVGHGGKLDGFVSQIAMVPDLKMGIAIFTNQESTAAYWSVIYHVLDYYMTNKSFDWLKGYKKEHDNSLAKLKEGQQKNTLKPDGAGVFNFPIDKIVGSYQDEVYGDVEFTKTPKGLTIEFKQLPHFTADLTYFQYNTFYAAFRKKNLKTDSYVTFSLNPDGTVESVKLKVIDPDSDIAFHDVLLKPMKKTTN